MSRGKVQRDVLALATSFPEVGGRRSEVLDCLRGGEAKNHTNSSKLAIQSGIAIGWLLVQHEERYLSNTSEVSIQPTNHTKILIACSYPIHRAMTHCTIPSL